MVDEYWCDNTNKTLPRDLIRSEAFEPSDIDLMDDPTDSAAFLFIQPALLVINVLIAALYTNM